MSDAVVPLVEYVDGAYVLNESTLAFLEARAEDRPLAVVACAGKFRTGKSFLLNRLLDAPPGKGFGVGETVQACTRGIWLSKTLLTAEPGSGAPDLLFLDTEGIDALDAESDHDVRVFALALLLSSVFLYNSQSHLDEAAVQTLSLMTRIADRIGEGHAPHLYWVLRDFSLQLADARGEPLANDDYLEQSLSPPVADKCATRAAIKRVFPTRRLVTLPRPHKGESATRLDHRPASVAPRFERSLAALRDRLRAEAVPIAANGIAMGGPVFVAYARGIVSALNAEGAIPRIEDAWSLLTRVQEEGLERQYRALVVGRIAADCPVGSEGEVAAWIAGVELPAALRAHPARDAILARVRGEAASLAADMGKVRDPLDLLRDEVRALLARVAEGEEAPSPTSPAGAVVLEGLLAARAAGVEAGAEAGRAAERDLHGLALRDERLVADSLRAAVEDLAARLAAAEAAPAAAERTDACVGADAPLPAREAEAGEASPSTSPLHARVREEGALRAALETARAAATAAEEEVAALHERARILRAAFDEGMDALRAETREQLGLARRERDAAREEAERSAQQRLAVAEESERLRALLREAQERALEAHRSSLEELRRRDAEGRALSDERRGECAALTGRRDAAEAEARGLKRRIGELEEGLAEGKRARADLLAVQVERTRAEAARTHLRADLDASREENALLRRANVDLESRLAVVEATAKLEECRRSLA